MDRKIGLNLTNSHITRSRMAINFFKKENSQSNIQKITYKKTGCNKDPKSNAAMRVPKLVKLMNKRGMRLFQEKKKEIQFFWKQGLGVEIHKTSSVRLVRFL